MTNKKYFKVTRAMREYHRRGLPNAADLYRKVEVSLKDKKQKVLYKTDYDEYVSLINNFEQKIAQLSDEQLYKIIKKYNKRGAKI